MNTVGVIAEYNPFHNGHSYQLRKARELTEADYVIVIMSPDFVQRGEPALIDKYVRTRMALENGADLVLELPVCFSTGSAEYFAEGAVSMLNALNAVDVLCFGCEAKNREEFLSLAEFFADEPEGYRLLLHQHLKQGKSFPKARQKAFEEYMEKLHRQDPAKREGALSAARLLSGPNNILALEYEKALCKIKSAIRPFPILRIGSDYHSRSLKGQFCSATAIRTALCHPATGAPSSASFSEADRADALSAFLPAAALELLRREVHADRLVTWKDFSSILHYKLLSEQDFTGYLDIGSALSDRILRLLPEYKDPEQFFSLLKTRQLTETRIRRALLHILLDISGVDTEGFRLRGSADYARILGFRQDASPLLHEIKKTSSIPLVTKLADAKNILSGPALQMLTQDISASHVYQLALCARSGEAIRSEFTRSPIFV